MRYLLSANITVVAEKCGKAWLVENQFLQRLETKSTTHLGTTQQLALNVNAGHALRQCFLVHRSKTLSNLEWTAYSLPSHWTIPFASRAYLNSNWKQQVEEAAERFLYLDWMHSPRNCAGKRDRTSAFDFAAASRTLEFRLCTKESYIKNVIAIATKTHAATTVKMMGDWSSVDDLNSSDGYIFHSYTQYPEEIVSLRPTSSSENGIRTTISSYLGSCKSSGPK